MNSIRIRKTIQSDTLHLPELGPFIGHTVDILIEDQAAHANGDYKVVEGTGDWDAVLSAASQLKDFDFEAQGDQDARDMSDVKTKVNERP
jgi:hypothetical protein